MAKAKYSPHYIMDDDSQEGNEKRRVLASVHRASKRSVKKVLDQKPGTDDGRSEWVWVRLANGDLILGVFPCGETYLAMEKDARFPDEKAAFTSHDDDTCDEDYIYPNKVDVEPLFHRKGPSSPKQHRDIDNSLGEFPPEIAPLMKQFIEAGRNLCNGTPITLSHVAKEDEAKLDWLLNHGFICGPRDMQVAPGSTGRWMIMEDLDSKEFPPRKGKKKPWAIVGDDYSALINEAYNLFIGPGR